MKTSRTYTEHSILVLKRAWGKEHDCTCGRVIEFGEGKYIGTFVDSDEQYDEIFLDHYNCPTCLTTFIKTRLD